MSIPDADQKLLSIKKRNLPNSEVVSGLEAGGLVMRSTNKIDLINSILTRRFQVAGDIVKVSRGVWGLREWHPNIRYKAKDGEEAAEDVANETSEP